ncbi:hypothetical protein IMG5_167420 [Ichthyophthirius multifiliis]|uniref:Uncharacterized protein n=1 Tax=Ichthyophthirius multifiliis TaxID=5932 RepID=G0R0X7_ICHMU|nr:hypothetical protein IMG5_167420 [Ichthyophthirius multifiliis]EGR28888.1 hypothetical protein IMG5_167420 [Ichthyophthirius multifiliis]|eukprot:XP_004030124.1 hypothetical protein IMG5_167420 [Ichthyophthirius multifiliis]
MKVKFLMIKEMEKAFIIIKIKISIQEIGRMINFMDLAFIYFKTEKSLKVNFKREQKTEKEPINILMEIAIQENGKMIKKMDMECMNITVLKKNTMDNGQIKIKIIKKQQNISQTEKNMVMEYSILLMGINIKDNGNQDINMETVYYNILQELYIKVNGLKTKHMDKELLFLKMVINMKVNFNMVKKMVMVKFFLLIILLIKVYGQMIKQMEKEFIFMLMVIGMKEILKMVKNKVEDYIFIAMEICMMANGKMTIRMDMENLEWHMEIYMKENGKMDQEIPKEFINFQMEINLKDLLKIIKKKEKEVIDGKIMPKQFFFFLNICFLIIRFKANGKKTKFQDNSNQFKKMDKFYRLTFNKKEIIDLNIIQINYIYIYIYMNLIYLQKIQLIIIYFILFQLSYLMVFFQKLRINWRDSQHVNIINIQYFLFQFNIQNKKKLNLQISKFQILLLH